MVKTRDLHRFARGCSRRIFAFSCLLAAVSCIPSVLAQQGKGEAGLVPQVFQECTAEEDAAVVFQAEDVTKLFKCPNGWELDPSDKKVHQEGSESPRELGDVFSGAKLENSGSGYKLTLPAGSDREKTTWYYTCKASSGTSSGADDTQDTTDQNGQLNNDGSSAAPAPPSKPEEESDGVSRPGPPEEAISPNAVGSEKDPAAPNLESEPESVHPSTPSTPSPSVPGVSVDPGEQDGVRKEQDVEGNKNIRPSRVPDNDLQTQDHAVGEPDPTEKQDVPLAPKASSAVAAMSSARSRSHRGARQEKRTSCRITVEVVASTLVECKTGETKTANVSAAGDRVAFKCAAGLSLKPEKLDQVYDDKDGNCASQVALTTLVKGSLFSLADKPEAPAKNTSYVLRVDELPAEQQAICYKCVDNSTGAKTDDDSKDPLKECLLKIAVSSAVFSVSGLATASVYYILGGVLAGILFIN
ncbi:hypothetical protein BESB_081920 [Besnoitia besnoiti]|uniref:SRS domain-containing protein n=1 Tax=Besnoitia besnoiti TaxID=94643 RepID=A0A2A9MBE1_BESBE|nr:hypothetical protein BESB_081920 [Besnoitia besnoiti]PFH32993.1 hypothetical protein BESB_081920 [Besnoitia besnoiti]